MRHMMLFLVLVVVGTWSPIIMASGTLPDCNGSPPYPQPCSPPPPPPPPPPDRPDVVVTSKWRAGVQERVQTGDTRYTSAAPNQTLVVHRTDSALSHLTIEIVNDFDGDKVSYISKKDITDVGYADEWLSDFFFFHEGAKLGVQAIARPKGGNRRETTDSYAYLSGTESEGTMALEIDLPPGDGPVVIDLNTVIDTQNVAEQRGYWIYYRFVVKNIRTTNFDVINRTEVPGIGKLYRYDQYPCCRG